MKRAAVAAAALLLAGCGGVDMAPGGRGGGDVAGALAGRTFLSETITEGGAPVDLVEGTRIRLEFTDGRLVAHAGCNTLFTDLSTDGGVLDTTGVAGTELGCDRALHDQDEWLARFLESRPAWALDGDRLTLTGDTVEIVLLDREVADPDRPLTQTRWVVDTVVLGDAAASVPGDAEDAAWLVIDNGSFTASTGCRDISGRVEVRDGRLRFSETVLTGPACPPDLSLVDRVMIEVLSGEVEFTIDADRLRLDLDGDFGLGLSADPGRGR
jgi:heat shock protein HslJ